MLAGKIFWSVWFYQRGIYLNSVLLALVGLIEKHPMIFLGGAAVLFALTAPLPIMLAGIGVVVVLLTHDLTADLSKQNEKEQQRYLKAYGKTVSGQRLVLITSALIFFALTRDIFCRFLSDRPLDHTYVHMQNFNLEWMFFPPAIYICWFAVATAMTRLIIKAKGTQHKYIFSIPSRPCANDQPGLTTWAAPKKKAGLELICVEQVSLEQIAANTGFVIFMSAFVLSVLQVAFAQPGLISWLGNWLLSSAVDANMPGMDHVFKAHIAIFSEQRFAHFISPAQLFIRDLQWFSFFAMIGLFWGRAVSLAIFLTSFVRRFATNVSRGGLAEAYVETMRAPSEELILNEGKAWFANIAQSFWWLLACYIFLLWFFGLSDGPIGTLTSNMIISNYGRAGFRYLDLSDIPRLRLFLGAIYALYGTVPLAVMSCSFIPVKKARRFTLTEEGMIAPRGFSLALGFMPYRMWSDFKSLDLKKANQAATGKKADPMKNNLVIGFHSGGTLTMPLSKLSVKDCDRLIGAIDELSDRCHISEAAAQLRRDLQPLLKHEAGAGSEEFRALKSEEFKSTIFVPFLPGDFLQGIRIVRLLSTKPLCAVYLARLPEGKLAVVKQFFLAGEGAEVESLRKVFKREHELLAELDNPHIARVLQVFEDEQSSFIVLQHWQGKDLRRMVEQGGPLPASIVIDYAAQLCRLMHYLHSRPQPVLHRDLSPDNVIIDKTGKIKLIDFGAAKQFIAGVTGTLIGKQCYMAPEQIRGDAAPGSDIYGFGCILHYLLTGKDPKALSPSSPAALGQAQVPAWLNHLVLACTAFEEDERPESFFALSEFFEQLSLTNSAGAEALLKQFLPGQEEQASAKKSSVLAAAPMPPLTVETGAELSENVISISTARSIKIKAGLKKPEAAL